MIDDLLTMSEIIQMVTDVRTKDASFIQKFAEFMPAYCQMEQELQRYGRDIAMDEQGRFTDEGYVRVASERWDRQFNGELDDIPDEYRITGSGEATERDSTIAVLIVEPGKEPYVKEIDSGLESLQHEVGGYIEAIYPYEDPVALVCNEEDKLEGLPLNRALRDEDGDIYSFLKLRNAAAAISEGGCVLSGSLH